MHPSSVPLALFTHVFEDRVPPQLTDIKQEPSLSIPFPIELAFIGHSIDLESYEEG